MQSFTNKSFAEHVAVGEREEACASYCALQESAAVQLLLDVCLTQQQDKVKGWGWRVGLCPPDCDSSGGPVGDCLCVLPLQLSQPFGPLLSGQREVVCLVCSHLHQVFIGNPTVAKLVHFQVSHSPHSCVCVCRQGSLTVCTHVMTTLPFSPLPLPLLPSPLLPSPPPSSPSCPPSCRATRAASLG